MNIRECFERTGIELLLKGLIIDDRMRAILDFQYPQQGAEYSLLSVIMQIYNGNMSVNELASRLFSIENFRGVDEIAKLLNDDENENLQKKIYKQITKLKTLIADKVNELEKQLDAIKELDKDREFTTDIQRLFEETLTIKTAILKNAFTIDVLESFSSLKKELTQLQDEATLISEIIAQSELTNYKESLSVLKNIVSFFELEYIDKNIKIDGVLEKAFCILPTLALRRKRSLLQEIYENLKDFNIEKLEEICWPLELTQSNLYLERSIKLELPRRSEISGLRSTSDQYYRDAKHSDRSIESIDEFLSYIEKAINNCKSNIEACNIYLSAAKAVEKSYPKHFHYFLGLGFRDLGDHLFSRRIYNQAFEVMCDSYSSLLKADDLATEEQIRSSIIGMILCDLTPKISSDHFLNNQLDEKSFYQAETLSKVFDDDNRNILFHCFDQFDDESQIYTYQNFLTGLYSKIDWTYIFLERILRPRVFIRNLEKSLVQLRSVMKGKFEGTIVSKLITTLTSIANDYITSGKIANADVILFEKLYTQFDKELKHLNGYSIEIYNLFKDRLFSVIELLKRKTQISEEKLFICRAIGSEYYLDECESYFDLILEVSVPVESLPFDYFSVEIKLDSKLKKLLQFSNLKKDLGPIEPGTNNEVKFTFKIEKEILQEISKIALKLDFYDGIKVVTPTDKRRNLELQFQNSRKGMKRNPYVAGPPIEKGGLYVGRSKELEKIKMSLIGQTQDNIPLILGIRRIGKTSLIKQLIADKEVNKKYEIIFYDLQNMPESEKTNSFFKKLCGHIHDACGSKLNLPFSRKDFDEDPIEAFDKFMGNLNAASQKHKVLLIFDEFEKLLSNLRYWSNEASRKQFEMTPLNSLVPEVLGSIRKCMLHNKQISFIISGLSTIKESFKDYESRMFGLMDLIEIRPLNEDDAKELVIRDDLPYLISNEALKHIMYMSGKQPFLLQLICKNLFTYMLDTGRSCVSKLDVDNVIDTEIIPNEEYFADYYRLIGNDFEYLMAIALCHQRLGKKRNYITLNEISDGILSLGSSVLEERLSKKLEDLSKTDRPLIERNPNKTKSYRIIIGMLGKILENKGANYA